MKNALLVAVGWCWLVVQAVGAEGNPPVRLAVELTDGSRVVGVSQKESISIENEIGKLQVSLRLVDQVRWKADREHVIVEMANGDRISGVILPEVMQLETLFGTARVPMQHAVLIKTLPAQLAGIPMADGLIFYAPFDDKPESARVTSRVGDLYGTNRGGQWVQGQRSGAFQFTAGDQAIVIADQEALRPKLLTITAWVKSTQPFANSSYRGILAKTTSGSWTGGFGLATLPGSPDVHFFVNYYGAETAHAPIPDDTWTHLAGTYDERTLTLYINGKKAASAIPSNSYGGPIRHDNAPLMIGNAPTGYGWFGLIDEVMLFDRVLSADEINRLYQLTRDD